MNEEIKEILDYLKDFTRERPFGISIYDRKILSDYITNLQQEIEEYQKALDETMSDEMNLQQENERLKEQNNDLRKIYINTYKKLLKNENTELAHYFMAQIDECPTFYVEPVIDYAKGYESYKSRCEKATNYYLKTLAKNGSMSEEAVEMFNLLEGNKWEIKM